MGIDANAVRLCLLRRLEYRSKKELRSEMEQLQTAVYVMCGGGFLGRSAARQPAAFYIDDRCGRLPYSKSKIMKAVRVLAVYADVLGGTTERVFDAHNCDVW